MTVDQPGQVAAARERLRAETSVSGLLGATARAYVDACALAEAITVGRESVTIAEREYTMQQARRSHVPAQLR
jgi:hypothetical protein